MAGQDSGPMTDEVMKTDAPAAIMQAEATADEANGSDPACAEENDAGDNYIEYSELNRDQDDISEHQNSDNSPPVSGASNVIGLFSSAGKARRVSHTAEQQEEHTDIGNARRLIKRHGANIRYVSKMSSWFLWEDNYWRRDETGGIYRLAQEMVEHMHVEASSLAEPLRTERRKFALRSQSRGALESMIALAQHQIEVVLTPDQLDRDPYLLGVTNGVVDLRTGAFREGRREDYMTKRADVVFDAAASCPNWIEFQQKITLGDTEIISFKQRAYGYALSGLVEEQMFIMHGEGANGKSTEGELIYRLMSDYAYAADKQLIIANDKTRPGATPEIVALMGKRFVLINELEDSDHLNESRVKFCTSRNTMTGRDPYEKSISFPPTHKPFIHTNHKPRIRGTDYGIWRRVNYLQYGMTFRDEDKIENYLELFLIPEKSGILNWLIAGFLDHQKSGLRPPASVREGNAAYKKEENTAAQWIDVAIRRVVNAKGLSLKELHSHYEAWMSAEKGYPGMSNKRLSAEMHAASFESKLINGVTVFVGIEFVFPRVQSDNESRWERVPF